MHSNGHLPTRLYWTTTCIYHPLHFKSVECVVGAKVVHLIGPNRYYNFLLSYIFAPDKVIISHCLSSVSSSVWWTLSQVASSSFPFISLFHAPFNWVICLCNISIVYLESRSSLKDIEMHTMTLTLPWWPKKKCNQCLDCSIANDEMTKSINPTFDLKIINEFLRYDHFWVNHRYILGRWYYYCCGEHRAHDSFKCASYLQLIKKTMWLHVERRARSPPPRGLFTRLLSCGSCSKVQFMVLAL